MLKPAIKMLQTVFAFTDCAERGSVDKLPMSTSPRPQSSQRLPKGVAPETVRAFKRRLEALYGGPIDLRVNDNSSTLLSMNRPRGVQIPKFSVHRMFLTGDDDILLALAQYLKRPTQRTQQVLRCFMDARTAEIRPRRLTPRALTLRARGTTYDLHRLAQEVNDLYFDGSLKVYVTWSRGSTPSRGRRRHIIFGSYDSRTRLVRIHPALDDPSVPEFFIKFVIFHEMLHAVLDPKVSASGRRCVHTPEFREREQSHPDYKRSMAWEQEFMSRGR